MLLGRTTELHGLGLDGVGTDADSFSGNRTQVRLGSIEIECCPPGVGRRHADASSHRLTSSASYAFLSRQAPAENGCESDQSCADEEQRAWLWSRGFRTLNEFAFVLGSPVFLRA